MVGIFNLTDHVKTENFSPNKEIDTDRLFIHMERVLSIKDKLKNYVLNTQELSLVEYVLNSIPYNPSSYRFEASKSQQENLLYRAEGIIGDIWENIKAFFRWIKEQFVKLFRFVFRRTSGTTATPEQEKKTAAVIKQSTEVTKKKTPTAAKIDKIETAIENKKKQKGDVHKHQTSGAKQQNSSSVSESSKSKTDTQNQSEAKEKETTYSRVKILKSSFIKEAGISNDVFRTIALLESKIEPIGKLVVNIFGDITGGDHIKTLFSESIKDYISLSQRLEQALSGGELFSREGFFYTVEKQLSPFGSPVFKPLMEEVTNIDLKYFNHFAVFFAGRNNTSVIDFNEKNFSLHRTKADFPNIEPPDKDKTAHMFVSLLEQGCFSDLDKSLKEVITLQPRIQKRIEAAINQAENTWSHFSKEITEGPSQKESAEAFKLISGFFRDILFVMHGYNNYIESLAALNERVQNIISENTEVSKLSKEDLEICTLIASIKEN